MNKFKSMTMIALIFSTMAMVAGCNDNSAEDAGEKVDEVMTDTGNAIEDACEDVKEGANAEDTDC